MNTSRRYFALAVGMAAAVFAGTTQAAIINLGTAGNFAVLAGSAVTNTGPSVIKGDVGVWSSGGANAITGLLASQVTGTIYGAGFTNPVPLAQNAQSDLTTAYLAAAGLPVTQTLTGTDLGGLTLTPGVYFFSSSAQLTGKLVLNDQGDPNAQFVFQIGSTLTTASNSSVVTTNNGAPVPGGCDVFWQVGSSATLGTDTAFEGHILALTDITLNTRATILDGSALARNGQVTLDNANLITNCGVPEPATLTLAVIGGALLGLRRPRGGTRSHGRCSRAVESRG